MSWAPGDLTAAQMEEEWFEEHGWAAQPPADEVRRWRSVAREQADYLAAQAPPPPTTRIGHVLPDILYVPAHPRIDGLPGFAIELAVVGGAPVVVGYSALDKLVSQCGQDQPWIALPPAAITAAHRGMPIICDPTQGVVERRWGPDRISALKEVLDSV